MNSRAKDAPPPRLYPHLQPECAHRWRMLIDCFQRAPEQHKGMALLGYGTIHGRKRKRWAYYA